MFLINISRNKIIFYFLFNIMSLVADLQRHLAAPPGLAQRGVELQRRGAPDRVAENNLFRREGQPWFLQGYNPFYIASGSWQSFYLLSSSTLWEGTSRTFFLYEALGASPGVEVNCRSGYRLQGSGFMLKRFRSGTYLGLSNLFLQHLQLALAAVEGGYQYCKRYFAFNYFSFLNNLCITKKEVFFSFILQDVNFISFLVINQCNVDSLHIV